MKLNTTLAFILFSTSISFAQVGINTTEPKTTLDVNGAITNREISFSVLLNTVNINTETSLANIIGVATSDFTISIYTPQINGHRLIIHNNTTGIYSGIFNGYKIPKGKAIEFIYTNATWKTNSGIDSSITDWHLTGNSGTTSTDFLGTTDANDLVLKTNNTERFRINNNFGFIHLNQYSQNTVIGYEAAKNFTTGNANTGIGYQSLYFNTNGGRNTALGFVSLSQNKTGSDNTAVGITALNNTLGSNNTGIGSSAGYFFTGNNNIAIGHNAGIGHDKGDNNLFIGEETKFGNTTDGSNLMSIANTIYGIDIYKSNPKIGINTTTPTQLLETKNGNLLLNNDTNISAELRIAEPSSGGLNYTAFKTQTQSGSVTYTLPASDGLAGQSLTTNGNGTLSWSSVKGHIGILGSGFTIPHSASNTYYCTGSYITLPPGKFMVSVYMMLSPAAYLTSDFNLKTTPGSFLLKTFFADESVGTVAGNSNSPLTPTSIVSSDVVGTGKLISGSLNVGQQYNPISGFVIINNTSGANKNYYYWAGWIGRFGSTTSNISANNIFSFGGTNYGEDNIIATPIN